MCERKLITIVSVTKLSSSKKTCLWKLGFIHGKLVKVKGEELLKSSIKRLPSVYCIRFSFCEVKKSCSFMAIC